MMLKRVNYLLSTGVALPRQEMVDRRVRARAHTRAHGDDDPEVRDWVWPH